MIPEGFENGTIYHEEGNPYVVSQEKLIVGLHQARIVGFSHVAKKKQRHCYISVICFLTYQPGFREVGLAMLLESESFLRDLGFTEIHACGNPGYHFHRAGWGSTLTNTMGHVRALFGINEY